MNSILFRLFDLPSDDLFSIDQQLKSNKRIGRLLGDITREKHFFVQNIHTQITIIAKSTLKRAEVKQS